MHAKNLFQPETASEIISRIEKLKPNSPRQWGKMTADQMLAHCVEAMKVATGQTFPPRIFIGKLFGGFMKPVFLNAKPFMKNSPTDKIFVITDLRNFEKEKAILLQLIRRFAEDGEKACTSHPHSMFGNLTPVEWATGMYKHLDHHLRQFGV